MERVYMNLRRGVHMHRVAQEGLGLDVTRDS